MQIEIVLTTDNSLLARIARALGAEWTHVMLGFIQCESHTNFCGQSYQWIRYHIIEATMRHGVIERPWNPEEYTRWAVYRLKDKYSVNADYDKILAFARGNKGKFYAFDRLIMMIPNFIRPILDRMIVKLTFPKSFMEGWMASRAFWDHGQRRHICSSLVDDCFLYADCDLVPGIDTPWVLPDQIAQSKLLELAPPDGATEWPKE